jgi:hypothetical protein
LKVDIPGDGEISPPFSNEAESPITKATMRLDQNVGLDRI